MQAVITLLIFSFSLSLGKVLIDLSYAYDQNTIEWPGGKPFGYTKQVAEEDSNGVWYSSNDFETAEHCGTHLDAPYHFNQNGKKVGEIPLQKLFTKAIFVNASEDTSGNPNYKLPPSKLIAWEKENGELKDNTVIFISFGWASRYPNKVEYLGQSGKDLSFPGISTEAAQWIVNTKKVVGVGVDTASADPGDDNGAHVILNKNDIYILENVAINKPLPPRFNSVILPMKLLNGTGAPCRIVAIV